MVLESDLCIAFYKQYEILRDLNQFKKNIFLFHVPNERKTSISYGRKLKRMGVVPGIADYCVMYDGGRIAFIEFKRDKRCTLSANQINFKNICEAFKTPYLMTFSIEEAINFLKNL